MGWSIVFWENGKTASIPSALKFVKYFSSNVILFAIIITP